MDEDKCWICGRTSKEIEKIAKEDGMFSCFDGDLEDTPEMFNEGYKKKVCTVCQYIIELYSIQAVKENLQIQGSSN